MPKESKINEVSVKETRTSTDLPKAITEQLTTTIWFLVESEFNMAFLPLAVADDHQPKRAPLMVQMLCNTDRNNFPILRFVSLNSCNWATIN